MLDTFVYNMVQQKNSVCFTFVSAAQPFKTTFQAEFSNGQFVPVLEKKGKSAGSPEETLTTTEKDQVPDGLFQCPNEGCICVYQTYNALENHTLGGKCKLRGHS